MDLSLRGSQINLAVRHKPKAPIVKYPLQRPRSANISRLYCHSPLLRRPFSADLKLGFPNCIGLSEHIFKEGHSKKNKKSLCTSSSNLFKLLLNEPIRRSWVCPDCDSNSVSSLGCKITQIAGSQNYVFGSFEDLKGQEDTKSVVLLNEAGENIRCPQGYKSSVNEKPHPDRFSQHTEDTNPKMSYETNSDIPVSDAKLSVDHHNFWLDSKMDLPGKVSFGRSNVYEPEALSDCENENGSAFPNNSFMSHKKSVHFEEHSETKSEGYDYNKCSTKNCDCKSIASPEPASYPLESEKPKCMCEFSCNSSDFTSISVVAKSKDHHQGTQNCYKVTETEPDESDIIRQYKDVVSDRTAQPTNDAIENNKRTIQVDMQMKRNGMDKLNNTNCFNNDLTHKCKTNGRDFKNNYRLDSFKQNDLSDIGNFPNAHDFAGDNTSVGNTSREDTLSTTESPNQARRSYIQTIRASSASAGGDASRRNKTNLKNARTFCCLREDSNLDEFHLDKVDSWMSLNKHPPNHNHEFQAPKYIKRYSPEDYEENEENFTPSSPQNSKSESQGSSTYEEIVSVIREIEEDKKQEKSSRSEVDMDLKLQAILQSGTSNTGTSTSDSPMHQDKLKDILSYLDDVESSCDKTLMETRRSLPESNRSEIEFVIEPDVAEDVPKLSDLLMLPNHQLARRVVALSLRANELANAIHLSKETVSRIRLEKQKALRMEKQNATIRIREQKKHYEGIVARHQGFIEQLLKDKASLCEKVTALTRRLDSQNQAWEHKLETELARAKETALAGEKIRRERWVRENTKKIKELTVKGLEAEINKMNSNHQQEVLELKRQHQQELLDALEEARLKHEELEKSMRDSLCKDRETTIEKERIAMRERFDRQLHEEQKAFDEQKTKLLEEIAFERDRLQTDLRQKENEFQTKKEELLREKEIAFIQCQTEFREKLEQQEQKYQNRINTIQKQFESDFLIWKKEFENAGRLREVENENTLRQRYRAERDHQIDVIVSKMDAESQKNQEEFEAKLSRMKEKYENDIRQAENLEKSLRDKCNDARNKLAESDAQVQNLQAEMKQLQLELGHSKKMCDDFLAEREQIRENLRDEVQQEIATIKAERDAEIQKIYKRVQQAIEKKDATLDLLHKENASFRERCIKLEAVIRQQRKDYCIK